MTRRPDRWWRPSTTRRPAQRARQRRMHTGRELDGMFDTGYATGYVDGIQRRPGAGYAPGQTGEVVDLDLEELRRAQEADPERFHQLAEAVREGGDAVARLAREWGLGDLLDLADQTGVTPLTEADPGQVVVEIEAWLRERGRE